MTSLDSKINPQAENATPECVNEMENTQPVAPEQTPIAEKEDQSTPSVTKANLVEELTSLIDQPIEEVKERIESLKQQFYKLYHAEQEEARKKFLEAGGQIEEYTTTPDESEVTFKELLANYKQRRSLHNEQQEREREQNLLRKEHLLEQMKTLTETQEDVASKMDEFKQLQQLWKTIGAVPLAQKTEINKKYTLYQEQFYDLVKINYELREYDFKKNLEAKLHLCETAEKLSDHTDVVAAFRELQKLHEEWGNYGPVAREKREELWSRFKEASTVINKRHQAFFEMLHQQEGANLAQKEEICVLIESIDTAQLSSFKQWEEQAEVVKQLQERWMTIGFAPRKQNQVVYDRYRAACNHFYTEKSLFYKSIKQKLSENLEKKRALCEQAEALKESTEWRETTEKLIALQKEWKTVGAVPNKYSNEIWKRFLTACDYFFDKKKAITSDQLSVEHKNLALKKEVIAKIEQLEKGATPQETTAAILTLIKEFNAIGHVPFKEKDKVYKLFRTTVDKQFEALQIDTNARRLDNFRTNLKDMQNKGEGKLLDERRKLLRVYDNLKAELATCENNIGFFSAKSSKSEGLIKEMERKINTLKENLKVVEAKIGLIDEKL